MRSDLRSLRERIRQVEAGGHRDTPLRRAYNRKLRAHRTQTLRGGGLNLDDLERLSDGDVWSGDLTNQQQITKHFTLYKNCILARHDKPGKPGNQVETMVVFHAPESTNKSGSLTFVDSNGKLHEFTNHVSLEVVKLFRDHSILGIISKLPLMVNHKLHNNMVRFYTRMEEHRFELSNKLSKLEERLSSLETNQENNSQ